MAHRIDNNVFIPLATNTTFNIRQEQTPREGVIKRKFGEFQEEQVNLAEQKNEKLQKYEAIDNESIHILTLSNEVLMLIFLNLPRGDLNALRKTCKPFYYVVQNVIEYQIRHLWETVDKVSHESLKGAGAQWQRNSAITVDGTAWKTILHLIFLSSSVSQRVYALNENSLKRRFPAVPSTIKHVNFDANRFSIPFTLSFVRTHFLSLTTLKLTHQNLKDKNFTTLMNYSNFGLEKLDLSHNKISYSSNIKPTATCFVKIPSSLKVLNLNYNCINEIVRIQEHLIWQFSNQTQTTDVLKSLKTISIKGNPISFENCDQIRLMKENLSLRQKLAQQTIDADEDKKLSPEQRGKIKFEECIRYTPPPRKEVRSSLRNA